MVASYSVKGDTFEVDRPRVWLANYRGLSYGAFLDLAPDGKRLAVVTPVQSAAPSTEHEVVFIENFFDELRRRVPGSR